MTKIFSILIILLGEVIVIYAEIAGAKYYSLNPESFFRAFLRILPVVIVGGCTLLSGYMFGLKIFKNIWIVSVISITSVLIVEPALAYLVTGQIPTKGALIGLVFGILGFAASLFL
jgi:hypothetical protein